MSTLSKILSNRKQSQRESKVNGTSSGSSTPSSPVISNGANSDNTSPTSLLEIDQGYGECLSPFNIHHINLKEQKTANEKEEKQNVNGRAKAEKKIVSETPKSSISLNIPKELTNDFFGNNETNIYHILSFVTLDHKTLNAVSMVNKKWNLITDQEAYWKVALNMLDSGSPREPSAENELSSKELLKKTLVSRTPSSPSSSTKVRTSNKKLDPLDPTPFYSMDYRTIKYHEEPEENIIRNEEEKDGRKMKVIDASTLAKLIEEMTHHVNFDNYFLQTFILTYRSFTNAHQLLDLLIQRFNIPPPENCTFEEFAEFKAEKLDKIRLRVISAIKYWLENFYLFDFGVDEEIRNKVNDFIELTKNSNAQALSTMLSNTMKKVSTNSDSGIIQNKLKCPPIMSIKRNVFNKGKKFGIMDYPLLEIARQMTLIDFEQFSKIEPKECLNQSWNKEHRTTKAPNINTMIQHFNRVSGWVGTEVVKCEDLEKRAKKMASFVELANLCLELNNFNAVFSIMSGLALAAIHRLKLTFEAMPEEYRNLNAKLAAYLNRENNFKFIRQCIKSQKPPLVPYVGIYLTDLTFIEEGSPKYIERNNLKLINFSKCRLFALVIRDIQTYQQTRYALEVYPELRELLLNLEVMPEEEMYKMSLIREERTSKKKANKPKSSD